MKKWRKRILWSFVVVLLLLVAGGGVLLYLSNTRPDWYRSKKLSAQQMVGLRDQAQTKLIGMQGWAQEQVAWPKVANRPPVDTDPTTAPSATRSLTLSEDELNALLEGWQAELLQRFGQYITDPALALRDGHIIVAVTLKDSTRVLSVHIQPKLDDQGLLTLSIDQFQAGRFPVPKAIWSSYTDKLIELLQPKLDEIRTHARMEPDGTANKEAVASAMNRLVLQSLKDKSADAVLFVPPDPAHLDRGYPAKVTDVKIENQALTLTFVKLTAEEQQHLLSRIRAPYGEEPPPAIASDAAVVAKK
jgi:hypothetical protein